LLSEWENYKFNLWGVIQFDNNMPINARVEYRKPFEAIIIEEKEVIAKIISDIL